MKLNIKREKKIKRKHMCDKLSETGFTQSQFLKMKKKKKKNKKVQSCELGPFSQEGKIGKKRIKKKPPLNNQDELNSVHQTGCVSICRCMYVRAYQRNIGHPPPHL